MHWHKNASALRSPYCEKFLWNILSQWLRMAVFPVQLYWSVHKVGNLGSANRRCELYDVIGLLTKFWGRLVLAWPHWTGGEPSLLWSLLSPLSPQKGGGGVGHMWVLSTHDYVCHHQHFVFPQKGESMKWHWSQYVVEAAGVLHSGGLVWTCP